MSTTETEIDMIEDGWISTLVDDDRHHRWSIMVDALDMSDSPTFSGSRLHLGYTRAQRTPALSLFPFST